MKRGKIHITDHAIHRYMHRNNINDGIPNVKKKLQRIYDRGKFILSEGTKDKLYFLDGWIVCVKGLSIVTCWSPEQKDNKFWINRTWVKI